MSDVQTTRVPHYSLLISWSDEDNVYVVSFPEWEDAGVHGHVHGETYAEAIQAGEEHLAFLIESQQVEGKPLPAPRLFAHA